MKQLHFVCTKCGHHLFVDEAPEWVAKLTDECPECGEQHDDFDGLFSLIGYGDYATFTGESDG